MCTSILRVPKAAREGWQARRPNQSGRQAVPAHSPGPGRSGALDRICVFETSHGPPATPSPLRSSPLPSSPLLSPLHTLPSATSTFATTPTSVSGLCHVMIDTATPPSPSPSYSLMPAAVRSRLTRRWLPTGGNSLSPSLSLILLVARGALRKKKPSRICLCLSRGSLNTRCKRRPALHPPPATRPAAISTFTPFKSKLWRPCRPVLPYPALVYSALGSASPSPAY